MNTEYIHHLVKPFLFELKDAKSFYKSLESYNTKYVTRVRKLLNKFRDCQFISKYQELPLLMVEILEELTKNVLNLKFFSKESIQKLVVFDKEYREKVKQSKSMSKSLHSSFKKSTEKLSSAENSMKKSYSKNNCFGLFAKQLKYKAKKLHDFEEDTEKNFKKICKETERELNKVQKANTEMIENARLSFIENLNAISKGHSIDEKDNQKNLKTKEKVPDSLILPTYKSESPINIFTSENPFESQNQKTKPKLKPRKSSSLFGETLINDLKKIKEKNCPDFDGSSNLYHKRNRSDLFQKVSKQELNKEKGPILIEDHNKHQKKGEQMNKKRRRSSSSNFKMNLEENSFQDFSNEDNSWNKIPNKWKSNNDTKLLKDFSNINTLQTGGSFDISRNLSRIKF